MNCSRVFQKKDIISFSSTALIWIILLIVSMVVQPEKKEKYEVIQLIFEEKPSEIEKKPPLLPEEKPVIEEVIEEVRSIKAVQPISSEKKQTQEKVPIITKSEPVKTVKAEPVKEEPKLVQSMEELMAKNTKPVNKEVAWDENLFESSSVEQSSQAESTPISSSKQPVQALSGTAASVQESKPSSSSVQTAKKTASSSVSSSTQEALQNIISAKPGVYTSQGKTEGVSFETQSDSVSDSEGVSMGLADGTSRRLLYPSKPVIVLSQESEKLITSSRNLVIVFTVLANGTVSPGNISFQPAGIIPLIVQTEIRSQISQWRFEEEKSDGQARLSYSINVK